MSEVGTLLDNYLARAGRASVASGTVDFGKITMLLNAHMRVAAIFALAHGLPDGDPDTSNPAQNPEPTQRDTPTAPDHPLRAIDPPITIAHRAGNSVVQAKAAEASGTDVVEADVWLHRGRLEVRHAKTLGGVPVRWDRWWIDLRPSPCLDLAGLLQSISPDTLVMLDLKGRNPGLPARVLEESRRVRPEVGILACSQNWGMLARLRDEPDVALVYSIGNRRQLARSWRMLEQEGVDAVSIHTRLLNPKTVRQLRERVPVIITWPINTRPAYDRVRQLGVDGLISDSPAMLEEIARDKAAGSRRAAGATG